MQRHPTSNWMLEWDVVIFIEAREVAFRRCFTCHKNPWRSTQSNRRRFEENLDKDLVYKRDPSLGAYLYHLAMLIAEWERDHQKEILRTNGPWNQVVPTNRQGGRQVHYDSEGGKSQATTSNTIDGLIVCDGCGRRGHLRSNCVLRDHPDFNHEGPWWSCKSFKSFQIKNRTVDNPALHKTKRADGSDDQPAAVSTPQPTSNRGNNSTQPLNPHPVAEATAV